MNIHHLPEDKTLNEMVRTDRPDLVPDPAIINRINHYFLIRNSTRKVHANSFSGFLVWIFSKQGIALKTGMALIAVGFLMLKTPVTGPSHLISSDTCKSGVALADSNFLVKDTCK